MTHFERPHSRDAAFVEYFLTCGALLAIVRSCTHLPVFAQSGLPSTTTLAAAQARVANDRSADARIELERERSLPLPGYGWTGADIDTVSMMVLAWDRSRPGLLLADHESSRTFALTYVRRPIAAAFRQGESLVEVIDAEGPFHYTLSMTDSVIAANPLPTDWIVTAADFSEGHWAIAAIDSTNTHTLFLGYGRDWASAGLLPRSVHVSAGRGVILVTDMNAPFAVTVLESDGRSRSTMYPNGWRASLPDLTTIGVAESGIKSLKAIPLSASAFVQTLTSIDSDLRVLVTYDRKLDEVRATPIIAPIGLTASRGRYVIGVLGLTRPELTIYGVEMPCCNE